MAATLISLPFGYPILRAAGSYDQRFVSPFELLFSITCRQGSLNDVTASIAKFYNFYVTMFLPLTWHQHVQTQCITDSDDSVSRSCSTHEMCSSPCPPTATERHPAPSQYPNDCLLQFLLPQTERGEREQRSRYKSQS